MLDVTRVVRPAELDDADIGDWRALQAAHHELSRPFFAPEWFRRLDEAGHDVEIAVLASGGRDRAFFPFHRQGGTALPPGGWLSDFQGWIGPADLPVDMEELLRAIGARSWLFNHLLACQVAAARHASERAVSPLVDLSAGFEAFRAHHKERGAKWVPHTPRKMRKISREVGELRFDLSTSDPDVLARLLGWKHAQRQRTRTADPLDEPWAAHVVKHCLDADEPGFAGILSALYAGDELIAAHLGLRSGDTFHLWFPAYDVAHERYSPGEILHHELFRALAETGIGRVDFGKGREQYKFSWMTGYETLADGYVDLRPVGRLLTGSMYAARRRLRGTRFEPMMRGVRRRLRDLRR